MPTYEDGLAEGRADAIAEAVEVLRTYVDHCRGGDALRLADMQALQTALEALETV